MNITITNIVIFLNSIISIKNSNLHNLIGSYEYFKPYEFNISKPLSLFIPYFYNYYILSFLLNMIVFNYIGTILEIYYEKVMYCKILFLCFVLTSIYAFCLSLIFKNIFEYSLFYYSAYCGFTPIIFALRTIYFNKLNRRMSVYGFKVHSKNIIWIELILLNLLNLNQSFYINLAGILSGNSIYKILKN